LINRQTIEGGIDIHGFSSWFSTGNTCHLPGFRAFWFFMASVSGQTGVGARIQFLVVGCLHTDDGGDAEDVVRVRARETSAAGRLRPMKMWP